MEDGAGDVARAHFERVDPEGAEFDARAPRTERAPHRAPGQLSAAAEEHEFAAADPDRKSVV